ncbi:MAG: hypothetical protein U0457_07305 [Candidatus Sericytochromatia bacterium]
MCIELEEKEESILSFSFIFIETKANDTILANLGYKPNYILSNIDVKNDLLLAGYKIPTKDVDTLKEFCKKENFYFEEINDHIFGSISVNYREKESYLVTNTKIFSDFENKIINKLISNTIVYFLENKTLSQEKISFYKNEVELKEIENKIHYALLEINRVLYASLLTLNAITDRAKKLGIIILLSNPVPKINNYIEEQENKILTELIEGMSINIVLKVFEELRKKRINNSRTRKIILKTIFSNENLELYSTKYRKKIFIVLEHALSKRVTSIVSSILMKKEFSEKEKQILANNIDKYIGKNTKEKVYSCLRVIFKGERDNFFYLLKTSNEAKSNLLAEKIFAMKS